MRIGHGYDVHRIVENRPLMIGGIKIECEFGLLGHSDADVLIHAIMDSILGALALNDIGAIFPDNDQNFKDIDSKILLKKVYDKMNDQGYKISNLDATVIAQKPKLRPYIDDMKTVIANILNTEICNINIKATTEENLGFTGNLQGISAHCVSLIVKK